MRDIFGFMFIDSLLSPEMHQRWSEERKSRTGQLRDNPNYKMPDLSKREISRKGMEAKTLCARRVALGLSKEQRAMLGAKRAIFGNQKKLEQRNLQIQCRDSLADDQLITGYVAAAIIGVTPAVVYQMLHDGRLSHPLTAEKARAEKSRRKKS